MLSQVMVLEREAKGELGDPNAWMRVDVDRAVGVALDGYKSELKHRGLDIELGEDGAYVADEQLALVEGMLRMYSKKGLGELMDQYRVLEVERDECWTGFAKVSAQDSSIDMQARADGLLQERSTGDLYVLSFKTAAGWDYRKDNDARHDIQGLSEAAVIERRLRKDWQDIQDTKRPNEMTFAMVDQCKSEVKSYVEWLSKFADPPRIMGIQMVHLIKGRREAQGEDGGGPYITQSHLLRGWYKEGITEREYAWRYKWTGPDVWADSGRPKGHMLGKGWVRFDVFKEFDGGVSAWVEMISSGIVQPDAGDPIESTYKQPLPYFRQDQDMQDWIEQTQAAEARVTATMIELERTRVTQPASEFRHTLNVLSQQNKGSCDWPSKCQFQEICFGDESMLTNPCGTGLYERRVPHHQAELMAQLAPATSNHEAVADAAAGEN
jgi:hypothetical protein